MAIDEGSGFATVTYKNTGPYLAANPRQRITERSEVTLESGLVTPTISTLMTSLAIISTLIISPTIANSGGLGRVIFRN